jgi:hypothetical protein
MGNARIDAALLGANWDNGANSGSRSANWNNSPSNSNGNIGGRGVCDDKASLPLAALRPARATINVVSRAIPPSGNT